MRIEDCEQTFGEKATTVHNDANSYKIVFTHADLVPRNIIVKDGHVAAIIDWGLSGWYPEYWEWTKAHYDAFPCEDWRGRLGDNLQPYDFELQAEQDMWRRWDQPLNG